MFVVLILFDFLRVLVASSSAMTRVYLKVKVPPNGVTRVDGATGFLPVETGQKNRPN